jgi:hypothetical protein
MAKTDDKPDEQEAPKGDDILDMLRNASPEAIKELASRLNEMQEADEGVKAAEANTAKRNKEIAAETERMNELVPVLLFKDSDKYKDDLPVGLNGKLYVIKRGVTVMVPRAVAEIVEHQLEQDNATAMLISQQSEQFANDRTRMGL